MVNQKIDWNRVKLRPGTYNRKDGATLAQLFKEYDVHKKQVDTTKYKNTVLNGAECYVVLNKTGKKIQANIGEI